MSPEVQYSNITGGQFRVAKLLIQHQRELRYTKAILGDALCEATLSNKINVVQQIIDFDTAIDSHSQIVNAALLKAAFFGRQETVRFLSKTPHVKYRDEMLGTALKRQTT